MFLLHKMYPEMLINLIKKKQQQNVCIYTIAINNNFANGNEI